MFELQCTIISYLLGVSFMDMGCCFSFQIERKSLEQRQATFTLKGKLFFLIIYNTINCMYSCLMGVQLNSDNQCCNIGTSMCLSVYLNLYNIVKHTTSSFLEWFTCFMFHHHEVQIWKTQFSHAEIFMFMSFCSI